MTSLTAQAETIRSAVTSVTTCTPTISASLKELLLGRQDDNVDDSSKPATKPSARSAAQASAKAKPAAKTTRKTTTKKPLTNGGDATDSLSPKEKAVLATHVVNATLKALGEAAKNPPASNASPTPPQSNPKPDVRNPPRKSLSVPMTPLQPRSLNRAESTPVQTKTSSPPPTQPSTSCLALAECARVAFATLRSLHASGAITLPNFQLESGMSSLVAKLIALKLFDQAVKELRILKKRLESVATESAKKSSSNAPSKNAVAPPKTVSDLLDYPAGQYSGPVLEFVMTAQLQALRIIYQLNKTTQLDAILPFLRPSNPTSPISLILSRAQGEKPEPAKIGKQLETLSQTLLSLSPSLASKDDKVALEPRLSPSPEASLEAQTLGLITRLESWKVSGHKGDVEKDILLPLSGCLAAFSRRYSSGPSARLVAAFEQIWEKMGTLGLQTKASTSRSLATIYQLLAKAFQDSGNAAEAKTWTLKWKDLTSSDDNSAAKRCAVTAQLLALSLKDAVASDDNENLINQVLDGMQGPLSGSVAELDDLLVNLCLLRKVALSIVTSKPTETQSPTCRELLEKFIAQLPRFVLRWLGKPPASSNSTKEVLRFEQRRQLVSKYQAQVLDSALLLTKTHLDEDRSVWETMDPMLQDSLVLLEYMGESESRAGSNPSSSYHVKISHLYYQQHVSLNKSATKNTDVTALRALKRSIECVKQQSEAEQTRAKLFHKWEAFVELCKASGRKDDAIEALRSIRDHLVRGGTVEAITASLATHSMRHAWAISAEAELLSRTVCNLSKLERRHSDWTWLLMGDDKATAAEHDLNFILMNENQSQQNLDLSNSTVTLFLKLHPVEEYPIRRLRSLLVLFTASIESQDQVEQLRADIDAALTQLQDGSLGKDSGLARYIPHLRRYAACVFAIASGEFKPTEIHHAIVAWKSMVAKCQTVTQLTEEIDDPQQLLQTLQALADLARMRGFQDLLTEIGELSTSISQLTIENNTESYIIHTTGLCLQYLTLGQTTQAEKTLQAVMSKVSLAQISSDVVSHLHLSAAEYYITVGKFEEAEKHIEQAREAVVASPGQSRKGRSKIARKMCVSYASFLAASLYLERGENYRALKYAKSAVRTLFHDWSELEQRRNSSMDVSTADQSQTDASEDDSSINNSRISDYETTRANTSPEFWALVYPLYRFTCRLSSTYEHLGMYQETLYYAEQAQKIARSMGASGYLAQATIYLASISMVAENMEKSLELVGEAKSGLLSSEPSYQTVTSLCKAASIYQQAAEADNETELLTAAESMLEKLAEKAAVGERLLKDDPETDGKQTPVDKTRPKSRVRPATAVPKERPASSAKRPASAAKAVSKKPVGKALVKAVAAVKDEGAQLKSLRGSLFLSRSLAMIRDQDWAKAVTTLRNARQLSTLSSDLSQTLFCLGISLMGQSLTEMDTDSVFSLIQDSTLSFPSVATTTADKSPHSQELMGRASPVRKTRPTAQETKVFVQNLMDAQECLLEAHSIATRNGNNSLVHRIAAALQNVVVLLANTGPASICASHPAYATCSVELARNLTWRRERKANQGDAANDTKISWPVAGESPGSRRDSILFVNDMNRFQREYVDIIPKSWNVVSLSLDDTKNDLCITKLQAGFSPFALRLPLNRASSRDCDNDVFDFRQGHAELLELIQAANRTCHNTPDMSRKGAKSEWWAEREKIDEGLKALLENIESTWLGGFKGIFTQHHKRTNLLARFQKTFHNILEKYLPSRRTVRGKQPKKTVPNVNLDPRILELFVGLGDSTHTEGEMDEPLTDLLYFVVDVLQFHGEINAYDEIDFDSMLIDTTDALHAYHAAAKEPKHDNNGTHTILILDKSLHVFPWESLPCLQGLPVSRVLSLDHLRRSIVEAKGSIHNEAATESDLEESKTSAPKPHAGHYVSINSGTYILNPGADLTNTQETFGHALSTLPQSWENIESRAPTESEFQNSLTDKDILLYFGHGSGAQYIRGRTIRQLEKCRAVALLMGCSSASLIHVGQFEPYGPVRGYMLAGSPAVVGTLWDVTDRDIDRFAGAMFEEWGLFAPGTFVLDGSSSSSKSNRKGKGKAKATVTEKKRKGGNASLVEAVAKARMEACRFKYLTAAAVCVYGIPVYIDRK